MLIRQCQRCGEDHEVDFQPLANPVNGFTCWGLCPTTQQPILMAEVDDGPTALDQALDKLRQCLTPLWRELHPQHAHREHVMPYIRQRDEVRRLSGMVEGLLNALDLCNSRFRETTLYTDLLALRRTLDVTAHELETTAHGLALKVAANDLVASLSGGSPS